MTLSPVFRSEQAVRLLETQGIWERFGPAAARQAEAVAAVRDDLAGVIGEPFRLDPNQPPDHKDRDGSDELTFLQEYFFLTLFLSLFESLGVDLARLPFYARLNFCIKGTITAADNLFDDQAKSLLPLRPVQGSRYHSILQLMCFERLLPRVGNWAVGHGLFAREAFESVQRGLLDMMAEIGSLEGSEEGGVAEIPPPEAMIEKVHRVRGGMLFGLAFVAPKALESGSVLEKMLQAEPAIAELGTAFQIVDDLTDFEFDLGRRSHNLLTSRIHHHGSLDEKMILRELWNGQPPSANVVEDSFGESARVVLEFARQEARRSLGTLERLGFWFPSRLANEVVHAIVGLDGVARMDALRSADGS